CYTPLPEDNRGYLLTEVSARKIAQTVLKDFQKLFAGSEVDPLEVHIFRRGHPMYMSTPKLYTEVQPLVRHPMERVFFANTDSQGPESSTSEAIAAARRAVRSPLMTRAGIPAGPSGFNHSGTATTGRCVVTEQEQKKLRKARKRTLALWRKELPHYRAKVQELYSQGAGAVILAYMLDRFVDLNTALLDGSWDTFSDPDWITANKEREETAEWLAPLFKPDRKHRPVHLETISDMMRDSGYTP